MGKNKLQHFAENLTFPHVIQPVIEELKSGSIPMKGKWKTEFFKNDNPLVVELGCGKGEYTVNLAKKYPNKNFIGVDIKGARIWRGAKTVSEENIPNAAFIRARIDFVTSFFGKNEVDEIWITFPDPQLKDRFVKKRLTHPRFLNRYKEFLAPNGLIHLKTDSFPLYQFTKETVAEEKHNMLIATHDVHDTFIPQSDDKGLNEALSIKTFYEQKYLSKGMNITYTRFTLNV